MFYSDWLSFDLAGRLGHDFGHALVICYECCSVHCTTQPGAKRGSDFSFSSCTVSNYLILMSEYFKCVPGTPKISRGVRSIPGVQK